MILELEEAKEWLRIDGSDEDLLLTTIMEIAQEKIDEFGVNASSKKKSKLLFLILVTDMYENRMLGISKEVEESIRGLKTELQFGSDQI